MTGKRDTICKEIWLHICKEGGKWSPEEIAAQFSMPRERAARIMHGMVGRKGVLRRYKVRGRAHFGVTADCTIPYGTKVADVQAAGLGG